jgi:hypothetical protein
VDIPVGSPVRIWKPRHAEHGARGTVAEVLDDGRVLPRAGWRAGQHLFHGPFRAVPEHEYRRRRLADPDGWLWAE